MKIKIYYLNSERNFESQTKQKKSFITKLLSWMEFFIRNKNSFSMV